MPRYAAPPDLYASLERSCEKVQKPSRTVLFRRGEQAFGMFLVLRGMVGLDFGVDVPSELSGLCGPGTLVGLPATLTRGTYAMTATVTDDAELGFLTYRALVFMLRQTPELYQQLLRVLSDKAAHAERLTKAMRQKERLPNVESEIA
jgi:CRP-like cAMP-binding protein